MGSADHKDEIERLRAQLREVELRLQAYEQASELQARQRRQTEQLFTAAFEDSPEAIGLSRLEDGLIVDVNREWLILTGLMREEVIGHTAVEIGHWPDQAARAAALTELRQTGRLRDREVIVYLKDKGKRLVRYNGVVIDVGGVQHVLMYLKDVTSERMAEESLRAGEVALAQVNEKLAAQLDLHTLTEELARVGHWSTSDGGETIQFSAGLQNIDFDKIGPQRTRAQARSRIHPEDLPVFLAARQAMDGRIVEYRAIHPDGSIYWRRSRMRRHQNSNGGITDFGVVMDVTAEIQTASALQEKLEFIEKLTSRVPDVLFQYQHREDGRISFPFINESVRAMFHVTPEAVREDARALFASIEPQDIPDLFASMRAAFHDGATWQHEFRIRRPDGGTRWVRGNSVTVREAHGELASYGAVRDITESKLAEQRLQESEARFRSLTDLSSDWYWETDAQFRFTSFAGYREGKSLLTQADSIGKTRWELGALNLGEEEWAAHRRVLESHQPFRDLEMQRLDAEGQIYWVAVSGTPIFDERGVFKGYRGIGRDISKRKRAEDETQRLAFYDTLTGLPNRRLLVDRLAHAQVTSA
ncbi:MAG: PAS domain S-box protein, partial [Curvibacter sp.]